MFFFKVSTKGGKENEPPTSVGGLGSAFGIGFLPVGTAKQIINADTVEISEFYQCIHGIIQDAYLVLRIGVLADAQFLGYLFLRVSVVNSQIPNIFEFHYLISHIITQQKHTISENEILRFIWNSDIMDAEVMHHDRFGT